jgi:hypothetical protein
VSTPIRDKAWAAIVAAHGHVQGKTLHMRADTLARALWEAGELVPGDHVQSNPRLHGRRIYGVRVVLDPLMRYGEVILK